MFALVIILVLAVVIGGGYALSKDSPVVAEQAHKVEQEVVDVEEDALLLVEEVATEVVTKVKRSRKKKTDPAA